jgi:hypothetical protein
MVPESLKPGLVVGRHCIGESAVAVEDVGAKIARWEIERKSRVYAFGHSSLCRGKGGSANRYSNEYKRQLPEIDRRW